MVKSAAARVNVGQHPSLRSGWPGSVRCACRSTAFTYSVYLRLGPRKGISKHAGPSRTTGIEPPAGSLRKERLFALAARPAAIALCRPVHAARPIADVFVDLNHIHKWDQSNGDTWDPFWADDDQLYAFNCDGRGFGTQARNLAFHQLRGDAPQRLVGRLVNSMDAYGNADQKEADGATWKALGQECIDGVFYAFVSRHTYGHESHDRLMRQTAANASLIASSDRGRTWTRGAGELPASDVARPALCRAVFHSLRQERRPGDPGRRRPLCLCPLEQRLLERRRRLYSRPRGVREHQGFAGHGLELLRRRRWAEGAQLVARDRPGGPHPEAAGPVRFRARLLCARAGRLCDGALVHSHAVDEMVRAHGVEIRFLPGRTPLGPVEVRQLPQRPLSSGRAHVRPRAGGEVPGADRRRRADLAVHLGLSVRGRATGPLQVVGDTAGAEDRAAAALDLDQRRRSAHRLSRPLDQPRAQGLAVPSRGPARHDHARRLAGVFLQRLGHRVSLARSFTIWGRPRYRSTAGRGRRWIFARRISRALRRSWCSASTISRPAVTRSRSSAGARITWISTPCGYSRSADDTNL